MEKVFRTKEAAKVWQYRENELKGQTYRDKNFLKIWVSEYDEQGNFDL